MSSIIGNNIKVSIFGQSHSKGIGVVMDGLPAGEKIDMDSVIRYMSRRAPGKHSYTTKRREPDIPTVLSGLVDDHTCGAPLCAVVLNEDTRSSDYAQHMDIPRPSHSDYPAFLKYQGFNDFSGGGHFSGRLTAPLTFAGAVCMQILARRGIHVGSHILSVGSASDTPVDAVNVTPDQLSALALKDFPVFDDASGTQMIHEIEAAAAEEDSIGGVIEGIAIGLPGGLGSPMFGGIENRLASAIFGIPAVRGVEFGAGFAATQMRGSQHNDPFYYDGDIVRTKSNNHGGILGGISTGMPIILRVAFKPTSSIGITQDSVSLSKKENVRLTIQGRHDPCIVVRAVTGVESAIAITLLDLLQNN